MQEWILNILLTGAGGTFLVFILARFISNDKLDKWGLNTGRAISKIGVLRFGGAYNKLENFAINAGGRFLSAVKKGLLENNVNKKLSEIRKEGL